MAKSVFHPTEIKKLTDSVLLPLTHNYGPEIEEIVEDDIPEFIGPTADDLRREAEQFKKDWEVEKQQLIQQAQEEADKIITNAQQSAFAEVKHQTDQVSTIKKQAEDEADEIIRNAQAQANEIIREAERTHEKNVSEAKQQGYEEGHEAGYQSGKQEVQRLIDRLHIITDRIMDKRKIILDETEQQIVELVLLISRKVVKVISENQRNVVMSNVIQSLRKVKGRGDVVIRVNMADVQLTTDHIKDFTDAVESVKNITIAEDSSVDKGGCIIETDFGAIDARISSQLSELEQKILEITPIKSMIKNVAISGD